MEKKIDDNQVDPTTSRRNFLKSSALSIAAAGVTTLASRAQSQTPPAQSATRGGLGGGGTGSIFVETDTVYGKVQGVQNAGVKEFKGIPYGATTAGRNRFMPPKKPASWKGVRECLAHGQISPQAPADLRSDYAMMIHWDYQPGGMGEDCLSLNIWTPGLKDGAKRPVLVSFHGGGFTTGSGNAMGYDGAQLARFGDVVVVTVNHRLASFGYTHLADLGAPPEFGFAGVAGIMDLTASLEWVAAEFRGAAERAGIAAEWRLVEGDPTETATLNTRYADLAILGQRDPEKPSLAAPAPEAVLLGGGRPILVVPYIGSAEVIGRRVLVAWNASREAARALNDALPLLEDAETVTVLSVNPARGIDGEGDLPAADIALHLARHDVEAEAAYAVAEDIGIGDMLLSRAADLGSDLIVMGGYGHSRLRELVLGGATRTVLRHMTVPVLLSH